MARQRISHPDNIARPVPAINWRFSVVYDHGFRLLVKPSLDELSMSSGDDREYELIRSCGKWKFPRGPWTDGHFIASRIFNYRVPPTKAEIQFMYSHAKLLGTVFDQLEALKHDIKKHLLHEQVRAIREEQEARDSRRALYLMRHKNGLTKIGVSNRPNIREKTLQAEDPRLRIMFSVEGAACLESRFHEIFDSVRVRGEWFRLQKHHVRWIRAIALNYSSKDQKEAM